MGYKCGNCNIDFSNKREWIEHNIDVHNSPFVEGDFSEDSDKILKERVDNTAHAKNSQSKSMQDKIKAQRC